MDNRRDFLKAGIITTAGVGTAVLSTNSISDNNFNMPPGIIYTKENPGKWIKKVEEHTPKITVNGNKVTIITPHRMSRIHYIVRHTIVTQSGKVLAKKTFSSDEDEAISEFKIITTDKQLIATSFCNKHDMWAELFII